MEKIQIINHLIMLVRNNFYKKVNINNNRVIKIQSTTISYFFKSSSLFKLIPNLTTLMKLISPSSRYQRKKMKDDQTKEKHYKWIKCFNQAALCSFKMKIYIFSFN